MHWTAHLIRVCLLLLCIATALPPTVTRANGVPVTLILTYLEGISNWGPRNATGISEFIARESELRLSATGLPQLTGEEYRVWIRNVGSGRQMSLATFNANPDGKSNLDVLLDMAIPDGGWNLMFISVEAEGSQPSEPSARRSLAGRWPVTTTGDGRPGLLPNTGGVEQLEAWLGGASPLMLLIGAGLGFALVWLVGVRYGRRASARRFR